MPPNKPGGLDKTVGELAIAQPNYHANITLSNDADGNNDLFYDPIPVPDGKTATLYAWGLQLSDGTQPTDLAIAFQDNTNADVTSSTSSALSGYNSNPSGIATWTNGTGSFQHAYLLVDNNSANVYTEAQFGQTVEYQASVVIE